MFLSTVPFSLKPLLRLESSIENSFEKDIEIFVEKQLENYKANDKDWMRYGFEYYGNILLGTRISLDIIPNIRDITQFVEKINLKKHLLYRGGRPGGIEPDKIKHVIRDILGIRTIIDIRGYCIFEDSYLTKDETLSRSVLWKYYIPLFDNEKIDNYIVDNLKNIDNCEKIIENTCLTSDNRFILILNSVNLRMPYKLENQEELNKYNNNDNNSSFMNLNCTKRDKASLFDKNSESKNREEILLEKRREVMLSKIISSCYYILNWISPRFAERWYINAYIDSKSIGEIYYDIALFDSLTISRTMKIITVSQPPILLHGTLGKDRVSVLTAIILSVLGVDDEYIIRDYCASDAGLLSIREAIDLEMKFLPDSLKYSRPEYMQEFLYKMKKKFGTIDFYLDIINFDELWRSRLRRKFLIKND